jgi:hypothetical protein
MNNCNTLQLAAGNNASAGALTRPRTRRKQRADTPFAGQPAETCRAGGRQEEGRAAVN